MLLYFDSHGLLFAKFNCLFFSSNFNGLVAESEHLHMCCKTKKKTFDASKKIHFFVLLKSENERFAQFVI